MNRPWQIDRRTFLRGLGAAIALPMLDAMIPPLGSGALAAGAAAIFPRRMGVIYSPNGVNVANWTTPELGANYKLPVTLEPMAAFRDDFTLISGLAQHNTLALGDGGGDHARASATFLTGVHPRKTAGADIRAGTSFDQIAAEKIGHLTRLPSLELSGAVTQHSGACDAGYSCAYQFNISWHSESMPMNPETDPRAVFERLFGDASSHESAAARAHRQAMQKSVLDFVMNDAAALNAKLGANDSHKMDQYLTAVRELEKRVDSATQAAIKPPPGVQAPPMFEDFEQHLDLMFDMIVLALQTDSTRIFTFILSHEGGNRPYPMIGISDGHHELSHHANDPVKLAKIAKIDLFHTKKMAQLLARFKAIQEGDGTLLDNSMILFGSGLSDGNQHRPENLPILLCGRGGGSLTPGRHLMAPGGSAPLNNLYLSMLDRIGAPTERFGDSTGKLESIG
jgi:hypothetical protein